MKGIYGPCQTPLWHTCMCIYVISAGICASGRYGEEFVAKRQEKLQRWSNRIARHPVLSRCEVVNHFFLCDDAGVSIDVLRAL